MLTVVSSNSDIASINIKRFLGEGGGFNSVRCGDALSYKGPLSEMNLFLSKHESVKRVKSLTCHTPGNYAKAEFGGENRVLSVSNAKVQTACLHLLNRLNLDKGWGFEASFEVTHHGPSFNAACLFIEIGSSEEEWSNPVYAQGVAGIVKRLVKNYENIMNSVKTVAVGVGGPHYAPGFTRYALKDESLVFGHLCPDYALTGLDRFMFKQMIDRTVPAPSHVFLDKGVKSVVKREVRGWCEELGLECVSMQ